MDIVIIDVYGHLDSKCRQQLFSNCLTSGKPKLIIRGSDEHLYKRRGQLKAWGSGKEITFTQWNTIGQRASLVPLKRYYPYMT